MGCIFSSEPYTGRDWNRIRQKNEVYYIALDPNYIVNPEVMPIVTTEQLQEAIPDFEWTYGHSGMLLNDSQAQRLEALFEKYLKVYGHLSDDVDLYYVL